MYNIIRKECAKGCELINIRAVESQEVDVDVLIRAINLAIELEVKIINLSLAWNEPEYMFLGGNSFACAHVTAIISKIISRNTTVEEAHRMLQENAVKTIQLNYSDQKQNFIPIKRAAVFPFSKEIQGILTHQNLIDFEIDAVYDIKHLGRVGANVSQLMPYARIMMDYKIKNIRDIDFNNIDTMIIGHRDKLKIRLKRKMYFMTWQKIVLKIKFKFFP